MYKLSIELVVWNSGNRMARHYGSIYSFIMNINQDVLKHVSSLPSSLPMPLGEITETLFPACVCAGGSGDAVRHAHPRVHEQHGEHHEAVVRKGAQRLQPQGL